MTTRTHASSEQVLLGNICHFGVRSVISNLITRRPKCAVHKYWFLKDRFGSHYKQRANNDKEQTQMSKRACICGGGMDSRTCSTGLFCANVSKRCRHIEQCWLLFSVVVLAWREAWTEFCSWYCSTEGKKTFWKKPLCSVQFHWMLTNDKGRIIFCFDAGSIEWISKKNKKKNYENSKPLAIREHHLPVWFLNGFQLTSNFYASIVVRTLYKLRIVTHKVFPTPKIYLYLRYGRCV